MKEIVLLKSGEIALKGLNRSKFEDRLIRNAKYALEGVGKFVFSKAQSALFAEPQEDCDMDEAVRRLSMVFGFSALARACVVDKDMDAIQTAAVDYLHDALSAARSFKVTSKRADKSFPLNSPQICTELGAYLLDKYPHLHVDVHNPDVTVAVEVRDFGAYIHENQKPGAGGIPVGSGGSAMLLLSGGIDSPVAGYMMAKRGLDVRCVHFASPPYTSERSQHKVELLCKKLAPWCGRIKLHTVPFTKLQEAIKEHCPHDLNTLITRRFMMKIADELAAQNGCGALITGESVGQVASQTLAAIAVTDQASSLPVLRPVIGQDKDEIVITARKIDTFETSILPYDDCCTVFTPKHPKTNPKLAEVLAAEATFDFAPLVEQAVADTHFKLIRRDSELNI